jgi:lysine-specific demethylase 8
MHDVPRIRKPTAGEFRRDWLEPRRPVVLQGLLDDHPLGQLRTLEQVRERLGAVPVSIVRNYMDFNLGNIADFIARRPVHLEPCVRQSTLAGYFDQVAEAPGERWIVTESVPADDLLADLALPALGITRCEPGYGNPAGAPQPGQANSLLFVGGAGNASDLHTDWDGRQVVLYQVFGRKRAVLFPPAAGEALQPIDVFAMLRLRDLPEARRQERIAALGGVEVVLEPGDALFIPAFHWHHLDYLETAMSVSFRFDGPADPDLRFLIHRVHRDPVTQNLWSALLDPARLERHHDAVTALRQACERPAASGSEKYRAMREACARAYEEVCLDGAPHTPLAWVQYADFLEPILSQRYDPPGGDAA